MHEGAREAADSGVTVVSGRVTELDAAAPLSPLLSALRGHVDLGELDPVAGNRYWLINRLTELIEAAARIRPVLIVLDDLHWADELTVLALRDMVPALRTSPVGWLLALRPLPRRSAVRDALRWIATEHGQQIHLGPLNQREIAQVCQNILGAPASPELLALADRSGGNPFLLEELITGLRSGDRIRFTGGVATVEDGSLPPGFVVAARRRLLELPPPVRQLLDAAAVLGRPFSLHEAAALLGKTAGDMVDPAAEAVTACILVEVGDELMFRHDLLRDATYRSLSAPVRQALHREAVDVVRMEGRPAVEAAQHLIRVARKGDAQAAAVLHEAATELRASAPSAAADLLLHLLELLEDDDETRPARIAEAVDALATAGRLAEARTWGERALRSGIDLGTEGQLLLGLAESYKHAGQNAVVVELADRALALSTVDDAVRSQLHAVRAHALLVGDLSGAESAADQAVVLGAQEGMSTAVVFGNAARSVASRARGHLDEAVRYANDAVTEAGRAGGATAHRHPGVWLGAALAAQDRFDEAEEIYTHGQRTAEQLGTAWSLPLWHFYRASLYFAQGRLSDVEAEGEAGLRVAEQLGALQLSVPLAGLLGRVAVIRAQMPLARDYLRRIQRTLATGITVAPEDAAWTNAVIQDAGGQAHAAYQALADLHSQLPERVLVFCQDPGAVAAMVHISKKAGQSAQAAAIAAVALTLAEGNPGNRTLAGVASHAEGIAHMDVKLLVESVELLENSRRPLVRASALEDAATAEHAAGRRGRAIEMLEIALGIYTDCGAWQGQARVERHLRAIGVRRRASSPVTASPLAGLTQAELRVVRLVVEGATNREVARQLLLSPHTVDSHLRHVFAKLGISSRVELTRVFMANAIIP
ncbi:DNA-binding CsgD family transcriptional regulator [Allocatelliglobosispora scoriae]|uniref:DNA-binding CsgD family transcriptional regulator n=1 Tax=Allocatelliglobosispora scoriae TaxID=643052 RepID=A0A841C488_9ACTN|nr:DNA-binding CsgD family transcriptional regulator [Allocatelliglobosispora scoriae]